MMFFCINTLSLAASKVDVRILVDVSGSMKKNDPKHLRRPAVRLITGMLPASSTAGVSLFGEGVSTLTSVGKVTQSWKTKARRAASGIHDHDMFTNIGAALESATASWEASAQKDEDTERIVVLLTDGMVDISKDPQANEQERNRIQQQIIPKLKALQARTYTIALSDGADKALLAQISNSTDAWFEAVKSADELEKVFLKIFEQSVDVPTVPLTDNKFKIDRSVGEFTALIFKQRDDPIRLIDPNGKSFEEESISSQITWFADENFDLVTINKPKAGEWSISGPVDPGNRVLVVSDLKLNVNNDELPANLLSGDELIFKVSLSEKGLPITRPGFLKLVTFMGNVASRADISDELFLEDNGKDGDETKGDGIYSYKYVAPKINAELAFNIQVISPTFERIVRKNIRVFSTYVELKAEVAKSLDDMHRFQVAAVPIIVDPKSLQVKGTVTLPSGEELPLSFEVTKDNQWISEIVPDKEGGKFKGIISVTGKMLSGREFTLENQVVVFNAPILLEDKSEEIIEQAEEEIKEEEVKEEEVKEEETDKKPEAETKDEDAKPEEVEKTKKEEGLGLIWWMIIGLAFNLIAFGGGYFAYKWWKKKQQKATDELAEELDDDEGE